MPPDADLGTATGHINIESSGAEKGAKQAAGALTELDLVVRNNWWGIQNLGNAFGVLSATAVAAFAGAGKAAVDWESSMAGVERTTYDSTQSVEENRKAIQGLGDDLRSLSTIKPIEATTLAKIAEQAGALGLARKDVAAFTSVVADLAATTDLTADEATTSLARISGVMGVPAAQFKNLASAILETGRSTQATEPEIVKMATRLAGIGQTVGLSADQLIGLSAAVSSVGISAEMGSTAIQKTFVDMTKAVSAGGNELALFARVAGESTSSFTKLFQTDAAGALTQFVAGLGQMQAAGQDVTGVLSALGENEARQMQTLLRLGSAQQQNVNNNLKLSTALQISNKAYNDGTALQEIAGRRYETTAAQIQILINKVQEVARTYGALFLPAIGVAVKALDSFVTGLQALPQPLQIAMTVLTAIIGTMGAIAAAFLLLGPRIILVRQALGQLAGGQSEASGAALIHAKSLDVLSASAGRATGALVGVEAASAGTAVASATAAKGITNTAASTAAASGFIAKLAGNFGKFVKVLGVLGIAASVASIAIGIFGANQKKAVDPANQLTAANASLVNAILQSQGANQQAADSFLINALSMAKLIPVADRLGISIAQLLAIIKGTADAGAMKKFQDSVGGAIKGGDKEAQKLQNAVLNLQKQWESANQVAQQQVSAKKAVGISTQDLTKDEKALKKAAKESQDALEEQNRAIIGIVDAQQAQKQAALDLQDAQDNLTETLQKASEPQKDIEKAERSLESSRLNLQKATIAMASAETKLANARANQLRDLADAENEVQDSQDKYLDDLGKITDAEDALNKLRTGPSLKEMRDATNKLAQAELNLLDAHQAVEDAEYQLQYLRQEGASNRDIRNAEVALAKAQQSVTDTQSDLTDSTEELDKLRKGADTKEISKAERDYQKAIRDSQQDLQDIADKEKKLQDVRDAVANDTAYRDALIDYQDAQLNLADANDQVSDSQTALAKAQKGSETSAKDIAKAQQGVEDAVISLAKANTEMIKQQALARGEFVDSGREAQILAQQIQALGDAAPTDEARKRLEDYVATLKKAKPGSKPSGDSGDSGGGGGGGGFDTGGFGDIPGLTDDLANFNEEASKTTGIWDKIKQKIPEALAAVGGGIATWVAGGAIAGAIGGIPGIIIGVIAGALIGALVTYLLLPFFNYVAEHGDEWLDSIGKFAEKIPDKISAVGPLILNALLNSLGPMGDVIRVLLTAAFGDNFDKEFGNVLGKVAQFVIDLPEKVSGLKTALSNKAEEAFFSFKQTIDTHLNDILNGFANYAPLVGKALVDLPGTLAGIGANALIALANAAITNAGGFWKFITGIPGDVWKSLNDSLFNNMGSIGKNAIIGFYNGIISPGFNLYNKIKDYIASNVPGPVKDVLHIGSPSKLLRGFGQNSSEGLLLGILDYQDKVKKASQDVAETVAKNIDPSQLPGFDPAKAMASYSPAPVVSGSGGAATPTAVGDSGDTINIKTVVQDAKSIADEIAWQKVIRTRK